jgi:glutamate-1-semialdehyde aminotransferase
MIGISKGINKSLEYWNRAEKIIPGGSQTLSKAPNMFTFGVYPIYLQFGRGSHVWDVDGNEYIDYPLALGPITLGYNYPSTVAAVCNQIKQGSTFSLMHPLEIEVAELLIDCIPCAEMVRFAKNGADATSAAIRLSRAYTGREHVAVCGYHGWHDWYIASTEYNKGVPDAMAHLIHQFEYNNITSLGKIFTDYPDQIAAVIMEPVAIDLPKLGFLEEVKELTHKNGSILIFDEIVTGFRLALGGAQEYFGVVPDLATFGKGMANGLPISALVGQKDIMKEARNIFFSTTYGGETLSLAASRATILEMKEKKVQDYFWKMGRRLQEGTSDLVERYGLNPVVRVKGLSPKFWIEFINPQSEGEYDDLKGLFFQEAVTRGILIGGLQYMSFSHSDEDLEETLRAFEESCITCKKALDEGDIKKYLKGIAPGNVFRRHSTS